MGSSNFYLLTFLLIFTSVKGSDFEYGKQSKWYDDYEQCSYSKQSPIELITSEALITYDIPAISFLYYDTPYSVPVTIQNNGHTANINLPKPSSNSEAIWLLIDKLSPQISGGPLPNGSFITDSVHFHWGSKDLHGSEHVIDSRRFSMEMHIVHRNGKYKTVEQAREHQDGLAVLSVIYNVEDNATDFTGLAGVISALQSITEYEKEAKINDFTLTSLFGNVDRSEFFTYQGSLTTPPCSQAVTWIVFPKTVAISHNQMAEFHLLVDTHGDILENNYRSLQSRGQRTVTFRRSRLNKLWEIFKNIKPMPYEEKNENEINKMEILS